ncbi:hypothetical protein HID58_095755 [Brassica napus]|uniref:Uncharacterized protein n=1 Tax=Brassica napus TaxID=3708 RepID=A0ABQ7X2G0_BRANA|nr:hypothetical protein HID58_095755 [Brassica napus]
MQRFVSYIPSMISFGVEPKVIVATSINPKFVGGYRVLCTEKAELIETGSGCATYPALMGSLPACSDLTSVGVVRYRVELSISDGTESAVFFVFYAEISCLTNVRAAEISELRSVGGHNYPDDSMQKQQVMSSILAGSLHSNNSFQELVAHSRRLAQSK